MYEKSYEIKAIATKKIANPNTITPPLRVLWVNIPKTMYNVKEPCMENQKTILLVEDEPLLGKLLRQRLEKEGFGVLYARDGNEAIEALKNQKPDLILLDVILPKMSGFEIMERIKNDPALNKAPIIVISNLGQEADVSRGEELGAVGYFVKANVSIGELVDEVKKFFANGK